MNGWDNFLLAEVGASAALAGLIFVGVSINLRKILSSPNLPNRAFEALLILLTVLVVSSLLRVPGQSRILIGSEMLLVGSVVWITTMVLDMNIWQNTKAQYRPRFRLLVLMNQFAVIPYLVAGLLVLLHTQNQYFTKRFRSGDFPDTVRQDRCSRLAMVENGRALRE